MRALAVSTLRRVLAAWAAACGTAFAGAFALLILLGGAGRGLHGLWSSINEAFQLILPAGLAGLLFLSAAAWAKIWDRAAFIIAGIACAGLAAAYFVLTMPNFPVKHEREAPSLLDSIPLMLFLLLLGAPIGTAAAYAAWRVMVRPEDRAPVVSNSS